ncbi:MAG: CheR family methyltransferase [Gammaproteobacteria bacterium]|nr:CheR family methyltransferase [Gammaproteobacteria bacterium]
MLATAAVDDRLPESDLARLSQWLADHTGLNFPHRRFDELERRVRVAAGELGYLDYRAYVKVLLQKDERAREFAATVCHFTVGETYFFRERAAFDALERQVLPAIIDQCEHLGRQLRIWSAACSTGEEPYSVAILLNQILGAGTQWRTTFLASDIDARKLEIARVGIYRHWSFRGLLEPRHQRYFESLADGRFRVRPEIQKQVSFVPINLARDMYPSLNNSTNALNLVLCRNALMYFRPEQARRVVERLWRCLLPGGWLIVGAVEAAAELFGDFEPVRFEGITVYRKPVSGVLKTTFPAQSVEVSRTRPDTLAERTAVSPEEAGSGGRIAMQEIERPRGGKSPATKATAIGNEGGQHAATEAALKALYEQGRYPEVAESALKLIEQHQNPAVMNVLARALANQGRLADALEWSAKAVQADELDAQHHYLLALVHQELGQLVEAISSLRKALYLDPKFVLAHVALGGIYRRRSAQSASRRAYRAALRLLNRSTPDEQLPGADGLTVDRLKEILKLLLKS